MPTNPARTVRHAGQDYEFAPSHPAADLLPPMGEAGFADLVQSVRSHGFDPEHSVTRHPRTRLILNGRHRELAARIVGVEPTYRDADMDDAAVVAFVLREDLHRRHMTASQRAGIVVAANEMLSHGSNQHSPKAAGEEVLNNTSSPAKPKTLAELMSEAGSGRQIIIDAGKVEKHAPELAPLVRGGTLPASTAAKLVKLTPAQRAEVVAAADPKAKAKELIEAAGGGRGSGIPRGSGKPAPPKKDGKEEDKETPPPADPARDAGGDGPDAGADDSPPKPDEPTPAAGPDPADLFQQSAEAACREIDAVTARLRAMKQSPLAFTTHIDSALTNLTAARKTLWAGRPCKPCPYCRAAGAPSPECKPCRGFARVKQTTYDAGCESVGVKG